MFVLRRITSDNLVSNEILGNSYNYISFLTNPIEFGQRCMELEINDQEFAGFIVCDDGKREILLHEKSNYYVMTSEGKTFEKLNRRLRSKDKEFDPNSIPFENGAG